ncbi:hypothetical protein Anapl_02859 [Anas platyrhynchos]|uniref:Uncharacterized protein n=1 Tax=Anas platyrhynchos TaxID=8839 RepID=R0L2X1_ANAPL|nr:hypothetical protein Anapl_02859 [Anas platyrhynchos]
MPAETALWAPGSCQALQKPGSGQALTTAPRRAPPVTAELTKDAEGRKYHTDSSSGSGALMEEHLQREPLCCRDVEKPNRHPKVRDSHCRHFCRGRCVPHTGGFTLPVDHQYHGLLAWLVPGHKATAAVDTSSSQAQEYESTCRAANSK